MTNRCLVYLFVFGAKVITSVMSSTIDEIILNATETTNESAYLQFTDGEVKVEFDMIFTAEQWEEIQQLNGDETHDSSSSRHKRKAIRDESFRWTGGVIPYKICTWCLHICRGTEDYRGLGGMAKLHLHQLQARVAVRHQLHRL
ncbi:uncharacterized protein LOC112563151 [Pomacea canaliculata]|uniref:uncharacterized protein LOC112563151 n=1 Tax=Pomacea canaliculata TaxID=400727 RepID=UPI000D72F02C|nr:uncharacterized protein LOC112563151 [Pomacea canaliculata]